jgi:hypothetical protein
MASGDDCRPRGDEKGGAMMEGATAQVINLLEAKLRRLEERISRAEDEGLRARWEFGRELLDWRVGKKLPAGVLDRVCTELGVSRWEIQKRMAFAEKYPDEKLLCDAITQWPTWYQMVQEGLVQRHEKQQRHLLGASIMAKREKTRKAIFAEIEKLADGDFHTAREWNKTFPQGHSSALSVIPWLTIEWNKENRVKLTVDEELRAICEGRMPRPEINGFSVQAFLRQLRGEITRRRKENHDERMKRRWNPDDILRREQTNLLDWIENELDRVPPIG